MGKVSLLESCETVSQCAHETTEKNVRLPGTANFELKTYSHTNENYGQL